MKILDSVVGLCIFVVDIFVDVETVIWLPKSFRALDFIWFILAVCVSFSMYVLL